MLVSKEEVLQYIPQRAPIVMVDALVEHEGDVSVSQLTIAPDNIFVSDGHFQMPGLVENIAQTAALRMGYGHRLQAEQSGAAPASPPVGFIGEVKNLKVHFLPKVNSTIQTRIEVLHSIFTASVIRGEVLSDGAVAAECEMKIFSQP
ncbi:MAG: 3-hydroxyacyl-ACP dehydratase [Bacteroidetes bacterium]|nr:3-hydroxyacyl-ACP dehydratase [Bacteroidota bacterium]